MIEYYLHGTDRAGAGTGAGLAVVPPPPHLPPAVCHHDPYSPVPPGDRRAAEIRDDVLRFTGPPLGEPLRLGGAAVTLYVSSTAAVAPLNVGLADVPPDASTTLLAATCAHVTRLRRGHVVQAEVGLALPEVCLGAGHRIRLELHRCAGCGGTPIPATDRVHHDRSHPSRIRIG
ncbi:CocE/NonD family hydrolase C-terminal non-catalytic domain-containing protein [Actinomadura sp. WMMA1423]|uniref:CocE/NonD family hydrolase C-terminal non-catalytic domain-containing protein n=1 Tax=Actinomadura sp. WMMA1423 TaxID=2591108 RepID=UPI00143DED5A|nr:CocE/NonD family hydrolase C-terminal non-catalytic domain-containing protein [Actinomadura sp. WMMA1423]